MKTSLCGWSLVLLLVGYSTGCTNPTACDVQAAGAEEGSETASQDQNEAAESTDEAETSDDDLVLKEIRALGDQIEGVDTKVVALDQRVGKVEGRLDVLEQHLNQSPVQRHTALLMDEGEFLKQFKVNSDLHLELRGYGPEDLAHRQAVLDGQGRISQEIASLPEAVRPVVQGEVEALSGRTADKVVEVLPTHLQPVQDSLYRIETQTNDVGREPFRTHVQESFASLEAATGRIEANTQEIPGLSQNAATLTQEVRDGMTNNATVAQSAVDATNRLSEATGQLTAEVQSQRELLSALTQRVEARLGDFEATIAACKTSVDGLSGLQEVIGTDVANAIRAELLALNTPLAPEEAKVVADAILVSLIPSIEKSCSEAIGEEVKLIREETSQNKTASPTHTSAATTPTSEKAPATSHLVSPGVRLELVPCQDGSTRCYQYRIVTPSSH